MESAFGAWLHEARIAKRISLRELAGLTGFSHSFLHNLETGRQSRPRYDVVNSLALALGRSPFEALHAAGYAVEDGEISVEAREFDYLLRRMPPANRRRVMETVRSVVALTTSEAA